MYYHFLIRKITYYIPFLEFIDITFNVKAPNIKDKKYIILLMANIREILRRLIKYLIMVLVVGFSCFTLIKTKLTNYEKTYPTIINYKPFV